MNLFQSVRKSRGRPALIRRWWIEEQSARGLLVWEYYLNGRYADCFWFIDDMCHGQEASGHRATQLYPLKNQRVALCEAKVDLTPEVIGQALVYSRFAIRKGAQLEKIFVFSETGSKPMQDIAVDLGLEVIINPLRCHSYMSRSSGE